MNWRIYQIIFIDIWHYTVVREIRIYENNVYYGIAIYCVEGQEKVPKYCVLRYGIILLGETGKYMKLLCIEVWHYTLSSERRM
jgi:hypothetical protein